MDNHICLNVLGTHCLTYTAKSSSHLGILLSEILVLSLSWCAWRNIHFPVVIWNLILLPFLCIFNGLKHFEEKIRTFLVLI